MSIDVSIIYKDSNRSPWRHPFSFQSVLNEQWQPLAARHDLAILKQLEFAFIQRREDAIQLVRELRFVESLLRGEDRDGVPADIAVYMLERLTKVLPALEGAIAEWEDVEVISI